MIEKLPEPLGVGTPKYTEFNNMLSKINELVDIVNKQSQLIDIHQNIFRVIHKQLNLLNKINMIPLPREKE